MACFIRVSAVFEDGTTVDNDKVDVSGMNDAEMQNAIDNEIASSVEWFEDRQPSLYMVSIYNNDRCVNAYLTERRQ